MTAACPAGHTFAQSDVRHYAPNGRPKKLRNPLAWRKDKPTACRRKKMADRGSSLRHNSGLPRNAERVSPQIRPKALSGAPAKKPSRSERFRGRLIILAPQKLSGKKNCLKQLQ